MLLSVYVIELVLIPIGDSPRNNPEMPAMLKLNAIESTAISTMSSLPSGKIRLSRQ